MILEIIYKNSDCQIFLFAFLYEKYLTLKAKSLTAQPVDKYLLNDYFKKISPTSTQIIMNSPFGTNMMEEKKDNQTGK